MNKKFRLVCLGLLVGGLFFTACEQEDTDITDPTIWLGDGTGFIHETETLNVLDTFEIQVVAENGSADLTSLSFIRGGKANTAIDDSNPFVLEVNGFEEKQYTENPIDLEGIDKKGFTTKWKLVAPAAAGENTYEFVVVDEDSKEASVKLTIITTEK
ncbi:MAG: hypothetical protein GY827_04020 [Cytophagales bacterium]|nr:hypothetical protein [Cytophagales bacterium]